ncbi:MAG: hypothetical protein E7292_09910 [Lachnospiraceae bacterium]|nr:hypothetical protein [Lachnospiraceae bacterium]
MDSLSLLDAYHIPRVCTECEGVMIFKGVGEYHCEKCGRVAYDDYGKVRLYLEKNPGANAVAVEAETGVSQKTIRLMLKEARIQVAEGSASFLHCENCRKEIRSGRFCPECEILYHRNLEEQQRKLHNLQGYGMDKGNSDSGHRRYMREND